MIWQSMHNSQNGKLIVGFVVRDGVGHLWLPGGTEPIIFREGESVTVDVEARSMHSVPLRLQAYRGAADVPE